LCENVWRVHVFGSGAVIIGFFADGPTPEQRGFAMSVRRDILHAEKQLTKALPKMAKAAKSDQLRQAFEHHLDETQNQIERLEQAFEELDVNARAKRCEAMAGLIEEAKEMMDDIKSADVLDAALITAAQKVEHYEIASYGSLQALAATLGQDKVAKLMAETLVEEKTADTKLNELATSGINQQALDAA
jgi:ferritin-like metal-binding protein YciE